MIFLASSTEKMGEPGVNMLFSRLQYISLDAMGMFLGSQMNLVVLANFMSTGYKLKLSERREPQLRQHLLKIQLSAQNS